jgi:hypothetical protein
MKASRPLVRTAGFRERCDREEEEPEFFLITLHYTTCPIKSDLIGPLPGLSSLCLGVSSEAGGESGNILMRSWQCDIHRWDGGFLHG